MVRPSLGSEYYAYILLYVDDILCIHHDAESVLLKVDKYFKLKLDSIRKLDMYMGAKIRLIKLDNGVWAWALISTQYVQETCQNAQNYVNENLGRIWNLPSPKQAPKNFAMWYAPELDAYTVIDPLLVSYY